MSASPYGNSPFTTNSPNMFETTYAGGPRGSQEREGGGESYYDYDTSNQAVDSTRRIRSNASEFIQGYELIGTALSAMSGVAYTVSLVSNIILKRNWTLAGWQFANAATSLYTAKYGLNNVLSGKHKTWDSREAEPFALASLMLYAFQVGSSHTSVLTTALKAAVIPALAFMHKRYTPKSDWESFDAKGAQAVDGAVGSY